MRRATGISSLAAALLAGFPRAAAACPSCMGRDDQGYLLKIMLPVGIFLVLPFIVFAIIFFLTRRMQREGGVHEAR